MKACEICQAPADWPHCHVVRGRRSFFERWEFLHICPTCCREAEADRHPLLILDLDNDCFPASPQMLIVP